MSYPLDTALLRRAGDLLAAHPVLGQDQVVELIGLVLRDGAISQGEAVALLIVWLSSPDHCDEAALTLLMDTAATIGQADPEILPWVTRSYDFAMLSRAVGMLAGRGTVVVSNDDLKELLRMAMTDGHLSQAEVRALFTAAELFAGRLTTKAQQSLQTLREGVAADQAPSRPPRALAGLCGSCSGAGRVTCRSCGGSGGHRRSGTRYRGGREEYYQEMVPCSCSGGRVPCGSCGGSGRR
jgi:hypothetical protein